MKTFVAPLIFVAGIASLSGCGGAARIDDSFSSGSYLSAPHADIRAQFDPKNSSDAAFEEASKPQRISVRGHVAVARGPSGGEEIVVLDPPQQYWITDNHPTQELFRNLNGKKVRISGTVTPEKHPRTNEIVLKDVEVEPAG